MTTTKQSVTEEISKLIKSSTLIDVVHRKGSLWWSMRATLKNFRFWHFFEKTFQKQKQFYFRFQNTFVSQMFSK